MYVYMYMQVFIYVFVCIYIYIYTCTYGCGPSTQMVVDLPYLSSAFHAACLLHPSYTLLTSNTPLALLGLLCFMRLSRS
jgi:hypothetical protein